MNTEKKDTNTTDKKPALSPGQKALMEEKGAVKEKQLLDKTTVKK